MKGWTMVWCFLFLLFLFLHPKKRDEQKKCAEFQAQCDSGDVRGCHSLGEFLHLFKHDNDAALKLFQQGCDPSPSAKHRRYAPSCFSAASMMYERGRNAEAVNYFTKACVAGSVEGCANLGVIYRRGLAGIPPDAAKADEFCEKVRRLLLRWCFVVSETFVRRVILETANLAFSLQFPRGRTRKDWIFWKRLACSNIRGDAATLTWCWRKEMVFP